jgi:hypothetical protein
MIAELLYKLAEQFPTEESHPYHPRPSLAGPERCIRQLDYYAQDFPRKPFPGRFMTILEDSTIHEMLIKDWIQRSAFQIHSEQMKVKCGQVDGQDMNGAIDGLITDILNIDRLLEIKAISHFGFQDIWNGHLPLDYITQTCLYLRGLKEVNPEISEALLFIKNKNQSQYLEILIHYDLVETDIALLKEMVLSTGEKKELNVVINQVTQSAIKRFEEVELYKRAKTFHERPYERDHWRCQYCPYGELCWSTYEDEFEKREIDAQLPEEFATTCKYYLETKMHIKEMEDEGDKLKVQIKETLKQANARKAEAGNYIISNRLQSKKSIDYNKIPPLILEAARQITTFEVLTINLKKGGKK